MTIPEIGKSFARPDAAAKVTGAEKYAVDCYAEDLLWAGVKRAGVASGRIRQIHIEAAQKLDGVVAVLTGRDVPGTNRQGIIHKDQPVLVTDKIRYAGDAVALVIARDKSTLKKAVDLIGVFLEHVDEQLADGLALDLGVGDAFQRGQEQL